MLTATTENGRMISLADNWDKIELQRLNKKEILLCPVCHEKVRMKMGNVRMWHFAHISKKECEYQIENESEYHMKGKINLYQWFLQQKIPVELERYLPEIKQRPDLLIDWNNQKFAIEFQCSTLDSKLLVKRNNSYLKVNIQPIWILGGNRLKQTSKHTIKLSTIDLSMAQSTSLNNITLIYYCSQTNRFCTVSSLTPLSSSTFLADIIYSHPTQLPFQNIVNPNEFNKNIKNNQWLMAKKRWRTSTFLYANIYIKKIFYEKGLPLCLLPGEAGIPLPSMIWIKTEPILWQGWILVNFILSEPIGSSVSFKAIYESFKAKVKNGTFQLRQLPALKNSHYSFAIMEYLQQLEKLGILRTTSQPSIFQKAAEIVLPKNVEVACKLDEVILSKIKTNRK